MVECWEIAVLPIGFLQCGTISLPQTVGRPHVSISIATSSTQPQSAAQAGVSGKPACHTYYAAIQSKDGISSSVELRNRTTTFAKDDTCFSSAHFMTLYRSGSASVDISVVGSWLEENRQTMNLEWLGKSGAFVVGVTTAGCAEVTPKASYW